MKRLPLFVAAATCATIASAQIQFGAKAGLNIDNLSVSPKNDASYSMKLNFNAGVLVALPIAENFKVQPEVIYSAQGVKDKTPDNLTGGTVNETVNLGYINVPILIKYQHESGLFAEIGPQVGFLLSAKAKDSE